MQKVTILCVGKLKEKFYIDAAAEYTRQQLAAILFRYTEYRGADTAGRTDLSRFSDSAAVADYARDALGWAVSAGLLQGRSDGTLDPSGSATRAQTAVILQRLETLLEKN